MSTPHARPAKGVLSVTRQRPRAGCWRPPSARTPAAGYAHALRRLEAWLDGRQLEEAVELATLDRVDWFNHRRLLSSIGDVPPVEYEEQYYQARNVPAMVAGVN